MHESWSETAREPGLFVIWAAGRGAQSRILDDLAARFHINRVAEFHWSPAMVWANYQRFYADTRIRGSAHARNKGSGAFLGISLVVDSPKYERRLTRNRGWRQVVSQMFDAKTRYREWTGGWAIHCTENFVESLRDTFLLFGHSSDAWENGERHEWNGEIEILHQDPLGANGWRSFDELFSVLNRSVRYALVNYGSSAEAMTGFSHGVSFDILASDYNAAHTLLHCGPTIPSPLKRGGEIETCVAGKPVKLNLRFPGDGCFDKDWANALLGARVLDSRGFYRPNRGEEYWLMAHRAVAQRAPIRRDCLAELAQRAADPHLLEDSNLPIDESELQSLLTNQLARRGIRHATSQSRIGAALGTKTSKLRRKHQELAARFRTLYFAARDTLLAHFPVLTWIKRSFKTLASGN